MESYLESQAKLLGLDSDDEADASRASSQNDAAPPVAEPTLAEPAASAATVAELDAPAYAGSDAATDRARRRTRARLKGVVNRLVCAFAASHRSASATGGRKSSARGKPTPHEIREILNGDRRAIPRATMVWTRAGP